MHDDECNCGAAAIACKGLAVMFIFIGLAIFLSVAVWLFRSGPYMMVPSFGWVGDVIGVLIAIWILSWLFRIIAHRHGCCCCRGRGCCCGSHCNCGNDESCSCCEDESAPAKRRARK
jgi:hypothetical protein